MTSSTSRRRNRADPLQDAKDAINNTTSMNEDDRSQLFATSVLELSVAQTVDVTKECITEGWKSGITLAISTLSVEDISQNSFLDYIVSRPNLDEETKVDILTLFLLRKSNVNISRSVVAAEDDNNFCVYAKVSNHDVVWKNEKDVVCDPSSCVIHFVQTIVSQGLSAILERIVSKLSKPAFRLALAESIGSNSRQCYQVLVEAKEKLKEFELEAFAIFLAASFGRKELLSTLLDDASETALSTLKQNGMDKAGNFVSLKGKVERVWSAYGGGYKDSITPPVVSESIFQRAIYRNHPDCMELLINKQLTASRHPSHDDLHTHCAQFNFTSAAKLLLLHFPISSCTLITIFDDLFRNGTNAELCYSVVDKLKSASEEIPEFKKCLENILFKCFQNHWFAGLFILVSKGIHQVLGTSDEITRNAEKTLNALVLLDDVENSSDIVKHLISTKDLNLIPSFRHVVLRSENCDLLEFFLSLNSKEIVEEAQQLKSRVKNEHVKKLLEGASSRFKLKLEAKEESESDNAT